MRKLFLGFAVSALILTSCAQNEILDSINQPNDGKIRFSAINSLGTKAAPLAETVSLQNLGIFQVSAFTADGASGLPVGTKYLQADVRWSAATVSWEYFPEPYWPEGFLNFFAFNAYADNGAVPSAQAGISNITYGSQVDEANSTMSLDFQVQPDEINQVDLVVAAKKQDKIARTPLIFKHALTQVVFFAGTVNSSIDVTIDEVEIVNVYGAGRLTVKAAASSELSWGRAGAEVQDGRYAANPTTTFSVPQVPALTDYAAYARIISAGQANSALLMLPQSFDAWETNTGTDATANAYIRLKARVVSTSGGNAVELHGDGAGGAADLFLPVASQAGQLGFWIPGRRVKYIITFGDTNSGSGGGGYDSNGNPILAPIRFSAMLEDWTELEVPVLSATFSGSSSTVNAAFVDGYTRALLAEINAAASAKQYSAKVTISGTITAGGTLNVADLDNHSKISQNSLLTFDFTSLVGLAANPVSLVVPLGWEAYTLINGVAGQRVGEGDTISLTADDAVENKIVLIKL